jgi:hypothetical protein
VFEEVTSKVSWSISATPPRPSAPSAPPKFDMKTEHSSAATSQGPNPWVQEWRLPREPWTFLVGQEGRIKAKFEGSESVAELFKAVRRYLVSPHSR